MKLFTLIVFATTCLLLNAAGAAEYDEKQANRNFAHEQDLEGEFHIGIAEIRENHIDKVNDSEKVLDALIAGREKMLARLDPKTVWTFKKDAALTKAGHNRVKKIRYLFVRNPSSYYSTLLIIDSKGKMAYWDFDSGNVGTTFRPVKMENGEFVTDESRLVLDFVSDLRERGTWRR